MISCRTTKLIFIVAILLSLVSLSQVSPRLSTTSALEIAIDDTDGSVKPGDDFYRYANGTWTDRVAMSAGQESLDTRALLTERTNQRVRQLIQDAATVHPANGTIEQKVGDYYSSFMDEDSIEAKGLQPLAEEMARISALTSKASLSSYLGSTLNTESDGLTGNADHVFGLWVNQGFRDSKHNYAHLLQGGLGMPDRDDYIDSSPAKAESRRGYESHIATVLNLAGVSDADSKAARILALETRMAQAFAPDADAADVFKQNNLWRRRDFRVKAPGIDWDAYFTAAGLSGHAAFIVWQPTAVIGISALVGSESMNQWKDYLVFHLVEHYSQALPKAIRAELAAFNGIAADRNKLAIAATNAALGQAVGQLYVRRYFPPQAKTKAQAMVGNLIIAYRARISNLTWMSPQTKAKALAKLAALTVGVGYPDRWIDYSTLDVVRNDPIGNMRRAEAFNRLRNLALLKQRPDSAEWRIDPQIVGAVIVFSPNSEFFSAGLLQPPYFDPDGDDALNYGSAGVGIAHEISHSFDELGNIYDSEGRLSNWWTESDRVQYHAAAAKLVAQFDGYCPFSDLCLNGKQVLSENIADLAGLLVAHDAYALARRGKADVATNGLSGEQRFFLAFAQRWRKVQDEAALRTQVKSDTHAPAMYRSNTVRNVEAWYRAYNIVPGDKLYLKPEDRAAIW